MIIILVVLPGVEGRGRQLGIGDIIRLDPEGRVIGIKAKTGEFHRRGGFLIIDEHPPAIDVGGDWGTFSWWITSTSVSAPNARVDAFRGLAVQGDGKLAMAKRDMQRALGARVRAPMPACGNPLGADQRGLIAIAEIGGVLKLQDGMRVGAPMRASS